ncbi:MAG: Omp28-related outer membrane protein [Saprospiraceae bacterium]
MKKLFILFLPCLLLFLSCEERMVVIPENSSTDSERAVLIEEFTGGACSACPQGAALIKDLQTTYGKNVVAVAIHSTKVGPLGEPANGAKYNFQTEYGDQIADYMSPITAIPAAVVDRKLFQGYDYAIIPFTAWSGLVVSEFDGEPEAEIGIAATYEGDTGVLNVSGNIIARQNIEGDIRIISYLTEGKIIDKQVNGQVLEDEYEHNHVLRTVLNLPGKDADVRGTSITSPIAEGEILPYEFAPLEFPKDEDGNLLWTPKNCHVIVFIVRYDQDTGEREVLQANEVSFIE